MVVCKYAIPGETRTQEHYTTGFLWGSKGGISYVASSAPSYPYLGEYNFPGIRDVEFPKATVIAHPGTKREREYTGRVMAYDNQYGLTLIGVKTQNLGNPFSFSTVPLKTGTPLCIASCQLPKIKDMKLVNRPIDVIFMHLGATRKSKAFDLLQLDGKIPEWGQGSPVVLGNGKVAGISSFQVGHMLIGMARPIACTQRFFSGRPCTPMPDQTLEKDRSILQIAVPLLDIQKKAKTCSLHVTPQLNIPMPDFPEDGKWSLLRPNMMRIKIPVTHPVSLWKRPVENCGFLPGKYWVQASTTLADGTQLVSMPTSMEIQRPQKTTPPTPQAKNATSAQTSSSKNSINAVSIKQDTKNQKAHHPSCSKLKTKKTGTYDLFQLDGFSKLGRFAEAAWSPDEQTLYTLETLSKSSIISRHSIANGEKTAVIRINPYSSRLFATRLGLLTMVRNRGLLLLDPQTLTLKKRLSVPGIHDLSVSGNGHYALGSSRSTDHHAFGHEIIRSLQVINLDSWKVEHVYCGKKETPPGTMKAIQTLDFSIVNPCALTADGSHLIIGFLSGMGRYPIIIPFQNGKLDWEKKKNLPWTRFDKLTTRPGSSVVFAEFPYIVADHDKVKLPDNKPPNARRVARSFDADDPKKEFTPHWAQNLACSARETFIYTGEEGKLRVLGPNDEEQAVMQLPYGPGWPPPGSRLNALLPTISGKNCFLVSNVNRYYLLAKNGGRFEEKNWKQTPKKKTDKKIADSTVADSTVADSTVADSTVADSAVADSAVVASNRILTVKTSWEEGWERQFIKYEDLPEYGIMRWMDERGKVAYALAPKPSGILCRLNLAKMEESHRVAEKRVCTGLCLSRAGVVVVISDMQGDELRLRDAETLELRQKWPLPETMNFPLSRPTSDTIMMFDKQRQLTLFDCVAGKITKRYDKLPVPEGHVPEEQVVPSNEERGKKKEKDYTVPVISRDGKYVFAVQNRHLLRLRLENGLLKPDGVSEFPVGDGKCLAIDDKAQYVAVARRRRDARMDIRGWRYLEPASDTQEKRAQERMNSVLILDAKSLLPVHDLSMYRLNAIAFDLEQNQLVTPEGGRIFPEGGNASTGHRVSRSAECSLTPFEKFEDGWFFLTGKNGFWRFRTANVVISLDEYMKRAQ